MNSQTRFCALITLTFFILCIPAIKLLCNFYGWKRSSNPTVALSAISPSFKYLQDGDSTGQTVLIPNHPFHEEIFPNIQFKLPLVKLEAIFSHCTPYYLEKETKPRLAKNFFYVAVENDRIWASYSSN